MVRSVWVALLMVASAARADPLVATVRTCEIPPIPSITDVPAPATHPYRPPDETGFAPSLDLYAPFDGRRGPRPPLVIVIHGGGWVGGSKRQVPVANEARLLAGQGYAVAALDYGLVGGSGPGTGRFPASVRDALCAVKWLKAKSAVLGFDPGRVAVLGHSAGGYLAAMIGVLGAREAAFDARFGADPLCRDTRVTAEVAGVAAYYPVTDMFALREGAAAGPGTAVTADGPGPEARGASATAWGLARNYLGGGVADDPTLERAASPFWWIGRAPLPPFFVVAGARDRVVPPRQSAAFAARLAAYGQVVQHSIVGRGEVDTLDHGFYPFDDASTAAVEDGTYGLNLSPARAHALLQASSCTLLSFLDAATAGHSEATTAAIRQR